MTLDEVRSLRVHLLQEKRAGIANQAVRWATDRAGRGVALGAGAGALHGAATASPEEGALQGGLRGAVRGGVLGGAASGVGRLYRDQRLLNPGATPLKAMGATATEMGRGVARFAKRQAHGFTGAYGNTPGAIGLRSTQSSQNHIKLLERRLEDDLKHAPAAKHQHLHKAFAKERASLLQQGAQGDEALKAGVTSFPGIVKGLAKDPKGTLRAAWQGATNRDRFGAALALSPIALHAPELARGDESAQGGASMKRKVLRAGLDVGGGILTGGMPIVPSMVASTGFNLAGG